MQKIKNLFYSILIFIFLSNSLNASVVVRGKLKDDVENAHYIVSATISDKEYAKDTDGEIITVLHLADIEVIKGNKDEPPQKIIYVGGIFNGVKSQILGMADYEAGNRYLFFLRYDNLTCPIVGLGSRSYRIRPDAMGKGQSVYSHQNEPVQGMKNGELSLGPKSSIERMDASSESRGMNYSEFRTVLDNIMKMTDYRDRSISAQKVMRVK